MRFIYLSIYYLFIKNNMNSFSIKKDFCYPHSFKLRLDPIRAMSLLMTASYYYLTEGPY